MGSQKIKILTNKRALMCCRKRMNILPHPKNDLDGAFRAECKKCGKFIEGVVNGSKAGKAHDKSRDGLPGILQ